MRPRYDWQALGRAAGTADALRQSLGTALSLANGPDFGSRHAANEAERRREMLAYRAAGERYTREQADREAAEERERTHALDLERLRQSGREGLLERRAGQAEWRLGQQERIGDERQSATLQAQEEARKAAAEAARLRAEAANYTPEALARRAALARKSADDLAAAVPDYNLTTYIPAPIPGVSTVEDVADAVDRRRTSMAGEANEKNAKEGEADLRRRLFLDAAKRAAETHADRTTKEEREKERARKATEKDADTRERKIRARIALMQREQDESKNPGTASRDRHRSRRLFNDPPSGTGRRTPVPVEVLRQYAEEAESELERAMSADAPQPAPGLQTDPRATIPAPPDLPPFVPGAGPGPALPPSTPPDIMIPGFMAPQETTPAAASVPSTPEPNTAALEARRLARPPGQAYMLEQGMTPGKPGTSLDERTRIVREPTFEQRVAATPRPDMSERAPRPFIEQNEWPGAEADNGAVSYAAGVDWSNRPDVYARHIGAPGTEPRLEWDGDRAYAEDPETGRRVTQHDVVANVLRDETPENRARHLAHLVATRQEAERRGIDVDALLTEFGGA